MRVCVRVLCTFNYVRTLCQGVFVCIVWCVYVHACVCVCVLCTFNYVRTLCQGVFVCIVRCVCFVHFVAMCVHVCVCKKHVFHERARER